MKIQAFLISRPFATSAWRPLADPVSLTAKIKLKNDVGSLECSSCTGFDGQQIRTYIKLNVVLQNTNEEHIVGNSLSEEMIRHLPLAKFY